MNLHNFLSSAFNACMCLSSLAFLEVRMISLGISQATKWKSMESSLVNAWRKDILRYIRELTDTLGKLEKYVLGSASRDSSKNDIGEWVWSHVPTTPPVSPIAQVPAKVSCQVDLIFKLKSYVWVLGEGGGLENADFFGGEGFYIWKGRRLKTENSSVQKIWGSHYAYNSLLGK